MEVKKHIVLARPGYAALLAEELSDRWALTGTEVGTAAVSLPEKASLPPMEATVFARQYLPQAVRCQAKDHTAAVTFIVKRIETMASRANRRTGRWTLHAFAIDDDPGTERAARLEKDVIKKLRASVPRLFKRFVEHAELAKEPLDDDLVIQIYVAAPDDLWLSQARLAAGVSPHIGGIRRMKHREGSPSRSSSKLDEAFFALGREPKAGETAVDLGAAPGGWTFTLAAHGAAVTAVDHAELKLPTPKKTSGKITHLKENGLKYLPDEPVDWLCCDMVIGSRESLTVLEQWLEQKRMRHFVVNVKLPQAKPWPIIKEALALVAAQGWPVSMVRHLYHDRREITLMGSQDVRVKPEVPAIT